MKKKRRAQITTELAIIMAVFLVFFLLVINYSFDVEERLWRDSKKVNARDLCDSVAWSINQVHQGGEGTSSFIYLADSLDDNVAYELIVYPKARLLGIQWFNNSYTTKLLTSEITGVTELQSGRLNITNNGGILLEQ